MPAKGSRMSKKISHEHVEMIPIVKISVLNPRVRNRRQHREIVENIRAVGLKRPITVSKRVLLDGTIGYDLVCGQGRLEAFQLLNQSEIPAFVTDATEDEGFVMGLVENVARRQHRPIELMREVGNLKSRGYSDAEIAERIGVTASWINMITGLLERGEERLLTAVETGLIPLSMATTIARSTDADVQTMLAEAYEQGELRGKKLSTLRRLLEQRYKRSKTVSDSSKTTAGPTKRKKLTPIELRRIYEREAEKQRQLSMKAQLTHDRLIFATEALKELMTDPVLRGLLQSEGLDSMPKVLRDRISLGVRQ